MYKHYVYDKMTKDMSGKVTERHTSVLTYDRMAENVLWYAV